MTNTAPMEHGKAVDRLVNGEFYAKGMKIFRAPVETKTSNGANISVGFPVCTVSEYVSAKDVVDCLNASREFDALKEEIARLREALQKIERWFGEFPATGHSWSDGSPMNYGACYGSNGEREFMREIARSAISEEAK